MNTTKRILVVDDSAFMRKIISDLIMEDPRFMIAGTASNGLEAIVKVKQLKPDAVTLDVEMPVCNGLDALRQIMKECPTPVIMMSSLTEEGRRETIDALENGAFDFVCKPSPSNGMQDIHNVGEELVERLHEAIRSAYRQREIQPTVTSEIHTNKIDRVSVPPKSLADERKQDIRSNRSSSAKKSSPAIELSKLDTARETVVTRNDKPAADTVSGRKHKEPALTAASQTASTRATRVQSPSLSKQQAEKAVRESHTPNTSSHNRLQYSNIIAVGTSTGGPRALKELLSRMPKNLEAPVFIVQHMPPNFTHSLAERLNSVSQLEVKEAEHGEIANAGTAYIAPGGMHMTVAERADGKLSIALDQGPPRSGHRPSVDQLFESLSSLSRYHRHVVLLTGMGSDGARAMQQLTQHGVTSTFAESEQTCIVYGMPRAAIELGCVKHIVNLQDMAKEIVRAIV